MGYLGKDGQELLAGTLRIAFASYLDGWSSCVSALMEDVPLSGAPSTSKGAASKPATSLGGGSDKAIVKDRLARFYECLDEMEQLHRAYPLSKEDLEIKGKLLRDVSRYLIDYIRIIHPLLTSLLHLLDCDIQDGLPALQQIRREASPVGLLQR